MNEEQKGGKWTEEGWRGQRESAARCMAIQWSSIYHCRKRKDFRTEEEKKKINGATTNHIQTNRFQETGHLQLSECWRLLYWATRDKARHRGGWTQKDHPRCQPQTEADRPSFHTWERPEPTNLPTGRTPTPAGSEWETWMRFKMTSNTSAVGYVHYDLLDVLQVQCSQGSRRRWWSWPRSECPLCTCQSRPVYSGLQRPTECYLALDLCSDRGKKIRPYFTFFVTCLKSFKKWSRLFKMVLLRSLCLSDIKLTTYWSTGPWGPGPFCWHLQQ